VFLSKNSEEKFAKILLASSTKKIFSEKFSDFQEKFAMI
jgi:hypothetical protein